MLIFFEGKEGNLLKTLLSVLRNINSVFSELLQHPVYYSFTGVICTKCKNVSM
jgi:hypothetical protein